MNKYFYVIILAMLASVEVEAQHASDYKEATSKPRLIVNIVVDQLCSENLEEFMSLYEIDGWRRLLDNGMVYTHGKIPFLPVDRASAVAALSTGSYPFYNGIPSAEWISRKTTLLMGCTSDNSSLLTPRGVSPSPVNLLSSTLSDEMKIASGKQALVYSVAIDSEAAVFLSGHCADGAFWLDSENGRWASSSYYAQEPLWLQQYNTMAQPSKKVKHGKESFSGDMRFLDYKRSQNVNSDVTDFALKCVSSTMTGVDETTDLLNIEYYAGMPYTDGKINASGSVSETYVSLDRALAKLINGIEERVGRGRTLYVLSSTGYLEELHTDYKAFNIPSGTVYINRTANLLNMYLSAIYGQAHYIAGYRDRQIYLDRKVIERRKLGMYEVLERCKEMLLMSDGISDVKTIFSLSTASDPMSILLRNGMSAEVSGDIVLEVYPGWKVVNEENMRTYPSHQYGFLFPIVFYGAGVEKGTVTHEVTTDMIAPTICKTIRIRAPNACKSSPIR